MAWYQCPACKKKVQRAPYELAVTDFSICGKTGRRVKLRPVKRKAVTSNDSLKV